MRSWSGFGLKPLALAAESRSAPAPAPCGDAIDVPLNIEYPGGSVYVPGTGPPACHSGVVETAEPGAIASGLKPPSSAGPTDEK